MLLVALAGPAAAGLTTHSLQVDRLVRTYTVYIPAAYDGQRPAAVVIMLHGAGATGAGVIGETAWDRKAEQHGFLAVFPDAMRPDPAAPPAFLANTPLWNDGSGRGQAFLRDVDDVKFLDCLVADLAKKYAIDPQAVFLTGFSNGASLAFRAAAELPGRFAAVAPVAGPYWPPPKPPPARAGVPTLFIVGAADPLNPMNGGVISLPWGQFTQPALVANIQLWAKANGCPQGLAPAAGKPGIMILACSGGRVPVAAYFVDGLGHMWPGGEPMFPEAYIGRDPGALTATDVIWDFFAAVRAAGH